MKIFAVLMLALTLSSTTACLDAPPTEASAALSVENCPAPQLQGGFMDVESDSACPEQYPSCADLGCVARPSGSPNIWTPCTTELCWCRNPAQRCVQ